MEPIKTAQRVCEVFEYFHEAQGPLALKDVVCRLGYPASSCSALLKSLVVMGYLDYDLERRKYLPTMRMPTIVSWIERARFGNGSVLAAMRRLHEMTLETVNLGAQSDLHAQYLFQIPTRLPLPYPRIRQTIRPLARSGLGWLLLSALDEDALENLVRRINYAQRRSRERVDIATLSDAVAKIRRDGYVFSKHTVVEGAGMIGMLIPKPPGGRQLALSVHGPVSRLEQKQTVILTELASVTSAAGLLGAGVGPTPSLSTEPRLP
jgi:IclR family transcriptional regulator, KDG regulon repressor